MAAFIYWFPGASLLGNWKQIPTKCELDNVLDGATFSPVHLSCGPDGRAGIMAFVDPSPETGGRQAQIIFDESFQSWTPVENESGEVTHWIGYQKNDPPRPEDLVRPLLSDGLPLCLGGRDDRNGQPYVVPLVELPDTMLSSLPKRFVWRKGGVVEAVDDRFADLCIRGRKQFNWMRKRWDFEDIDLVDTWMAEYEQFYYAVDCLNVNYRIGAPEACVLGLPNSTEIAYIIRYSLGLPYFDAQVKAAASKKNFRTQRDT